MKHTTEDLKSENSIRRHIRDGLIFSLPQPSRHAHILHHAEFPVGKANDESEIQGFLCNNGSFLDRRNAYNLAATNGQLRRRLGGYDGPELFSEDLWW